jgi:hypothetical protein
LVSVSPPKEIVSYKALSNESDTSPCRSSIRKASIKACFIHPADFLTFNVLASIYCVCRLLAISSQSPILSPLYDFA